MRDWTVDGEAVRRAREPDVAVVLDLLVEVRDDGRGFTLAAVRPNGLVGLGSRVEAPWGELRVRSANLGPLGPLGPDPSPTHRG